MTDHATPGGAICRVPTPVADAAPVPPLLQLLQLLRRLRAAWRHRWSRRTARLDPERLSDAQLRDLGLPRDSFRAAPHRLR